MSEIELWKMFEKTGSINDYLNYACTTESDFEKEGYAMCSISEEVENFE